MKRFVLLLGTITAFAGCNRHQRPLASRWLSREAVVIDLPVVAQKELYTCGLTSLTVLCTYYGAEVPDEGRKKLAALAKQKKGVSGQEIKAFLESLGFEVFVFPGTLDHEVTGLYRHIDRGRPPIVMTSRDGRKNHYELFMGYDASRENVILLDPRRGAVILSRSRFEELWKKALRFTLLAVPRGSGEKRKQASSRAHTSKDGTLEEGKQ